MREEILKHLGPVAVVGREILYYDEIDSTNTCTKRLAQEGAADGTAVIAGLAVSCVDIKMALTFERGGENILDMQGFLDLLFPGALSAAYTGLLFYLIRVKGWTMYKLVGLTLGVGILFQAAGVLE